MASRTPWNLDEDVEPQPVYHPLSTDGVLWLIVIGLIGLAMVGVVVIHDLSVQLNRLQSTAITCQEDMPCWDCTTMGNKLCGPSK